LLLSIRQFIRAFHQPDSAAILDGGATGGSIATVVFGAAVSVFGSGVAVAVVVAGVRSSPRAGGSCSGPGWKAVREQGRHK